MIEFTDDQETTFLIFEPTLDRELQVELGSEHLASVRFKQKPQITCTTPERTDAALTACESILNAEWDTGLTVAARDVQIVEAQVGDEGSADRLLGFYLFGLDDGANGLRIRFGFQEPGGSWVTVRLTSVVLRHGGSVAAAPATEVVLSVER